MSEINAPSNQTPTDMVFSQTSQKTRSVLKVVEIDRLKNGNGHPTNGLTGVVTAEKIESTIQRSPSADASFSEEFLKSESQFENAMYHEMDCEYFQDLDPWCYAPAKDEQALIIDSAKILGERANNTDTLHTPVSPQGWETGAPSPAAPTDFYNTTPIGKLSPIIEDYFKYDSPLFSSFNEKFLDISKLPVVIEDIAPDAVAGPSPRQAPGSAGWTDTQHTYNSSGVTQHTYNTSGVTQNTSYNTTNTHNRMPFKNQPEDTADTHIPLLAVPREVEVISVVDDEDAFEIKETVGRSLVLNVAARDPWWQAELVTTPDVLIAVEELERNDPLVYMNVAEPTATRAQFAPTDTCAQGTVPTAAPSPAHVQHSPDTFKGECQEDSDSDTKTTKRKRRRHDSEDSDETYTPRVERTTRKYKRRKPNVPIKDIILALEESQQTKPVRRGRPPKRRESVVSSVCSVDGDASSTSTHEHKYRELRDKNNEASKRSRMNRKLKELQMEQLAVELEETNKKLRIKAETLEEMTKRLKDAFMATILKK